MLQKYRPSSRLLLFLITLYGFFLSFAQYCAGKGSSPVCSYEPKTRLNTCEMTSPMVFRTLNLYSTRVWWSSSLGASLCDYLPIGDVIFEKLLV